MDDKLITLLIFGACFWLVFGFAAVVGTIYRFQLINRLLRSVRSGRFRDFSSKNITGKMRSLFILALLSIIGIFLTLILGMCGVFSLHPKIFTILMIGSLFLLLIAGSMIFREVFTRID